MEAALAAIDADLSHALVGYLAIGPEAPPAPIVQASSVGTALIEAICAVTRRTRSDVLAEIGSDEEDQGMRAWVWAVRALRAHESDTIVRTRNEVVDVPLPSVKKRELHRAWSVLGNLIGDLPAE